VKEVGGTPKLKLVVTGQGRRQRSTVEWKVRACVEAYQGEIVSKAVRGIST
jgi:hypothetical protein